MSIAEPIDRLLSNDPPEIDAALEWVEGASAEQLHDFLQGLDLSLPSTYRIALAVNAMLRKLADGAKAHGELTSMHGQR